VKVCVPVTVFVCVWLFECYRVLFPIFREVTPQFLEFQGRGCGVS